MIFYPAHLYRAKLAYLFATSEYICMFFVRAKHWQHALIVKLHACLLPETIRHGLSFEFYDLVNAVTSVES